MKEVCERCAGAITCVIMLAVLVSCEEPVDETVSAAALRGEVEAWRAERLAALTADDGWLTVVELAWLEPGENRVGSGPDAAVVLPAEKAPPAVGSFVLEGDAVTFQAAPGVSGVEVIEPGTPAAPAEPADSESGEAAAAPAPLEPGPLAPGRTIRVATGAGGAPTVLGLGGLRFFVIERSGRFGIRVKDPDSPARRGFEGLDYFPVDPDWRVEARFVPHAEPKTVPVPNVIGTVYDEPSPGVAEFQIDGETHRLDVIGEAYEGEMFFVFGDATNGKGTYGGGRFLYAPVPGDDGRMVLDFNRAYNPPCAFTAFATCPLPPPGNDLPVAVEAGEMAYHGPGGHA